MGLQNPIKWHGGKSYLAKAIINLMPPRCKSPNSPVASDPGWLHYVEPFAGGLSVLLSQDPEGISEVANDLNLELTNFWRVLQSEELFARFYRTLDAMPFSEAEYQAVSKEGLLNTPHSASDESDRVDAVSRAVSFFVFCRQSLAGRMGSFAPLSRNRVRRGMNEQASAWMSAVAGLPDVHARLKRVAILNRAAAEVIKQQDGSRTLFYLDPPYLHETRTTTGEYRHEMTADDHENLLDIISKISGRFLLSGYRSNLYDSFATKNKWRRVDIEIDNKASSKRIKDKKIESVWMNY